MGRVVGDGGCNFEVVDIAVDPKYPGGGLGKQIMEEIMNYLDAEAPSGSFISLIADAPGLYEKFGFQKITSSAQAMYIKK